MGRMIVLVALMALASLANADEEELVLNTEFIAGTYAVQPYVHFDSEVTEDLGITRQTVIDAVELGLRSNGVRMEYEEGDKGFATLNVTLYVMRIGETEIYIHYSDVELERTLMGTIFDYGPSMVFSTVWESAHMGWGGSGRLHDDIVHGVRGMVDKFSLAFLRANPRS